MLHILQGSAGVDGLLNGGHVACGLVGNFWAGAAAHVKFFEMSVRKSRNYRDIPRYRITAYGILKR